MFLVQLGKATAMQAIFFDEAGFTGDALLDPDQPFFVYSGVAVEPDEAERFVADVRRDSQALEVKGRLLMRRPASRQRVVALLTALQGRYRVAMFHKRMALAYKFYEYVFEPVVAAFNSFYYDLGLHYFVGQSVHLANVLNERVGINIIREFESLMRRGDFEGAVTLFGLSEADQSNMPISLIRDFAQIHADKIREEVLGREGDGVKQWMLDLTLTSLHSLLGEFSEQYDLMQPVCDEAKPLVGTAGLFDAMIGRQDKLYVHGPRFTARVTYNLADAIQLRSSAQIPGLQIADVVSSATGWALNHRDEADAKTILRLTEGHVCRGSILETFEDIDFTSSDQAMLNWLVLAELVRRSRASSSLIDGMDEFVSACRVMIPEQRLKLGTE